MKKITLFLVTALLCTGLFAAERTDVLTISSFGTPGISYTDVTATGQSGTHYVAQMAGGNSSIQLRSTNSNSGIVTTTSIGTVKSISIKWNENTTNDTRVVDVYGNNQAYTAPTQLYNDIVGTQIASFPLTAGNTTINIEGNYQYIGLRSKSGSVWIDEITIVWEERGEDVPATDLTLAEQTLSLEQYKYGVAINATLAPENTTDFITWSSDNEAVALVDAAGKVTGVAPGTANITASVRDLTATCAVTVTEPTILNCAQAAEIALAVSANNEVAAGGKYVVQGYIVNVVTTEENFPNFNNYNIWLSDDPDAAEGEGTFQAYNAVSTDFGTTWHVFTPGTKIELVGDLTKYNDTPETVGGGNASFRILSETALPSTTISTPAAKRIIDGILVIEKDGTLYNAQGTRL